MDSSIKELPIYAKLSLIILGTVAFFYILSIGQNIIVPLVFSIIIAILLNPVVNYLSSKKINRIVAIFMALTAAILVIIALLYFIGSQATMFSESFPKLEQKFTLLFNDTIIWVSETFNIDRVKIESWITKIKGEGMQNSSAIIGQTLGTVSGMVVFVLLIPVYIFMLLFYKPLLLEFISQLFHSDKHAVVEEVLVETKTLIQSYLIGLLLEAAIVAILNATGLLLIGLDYAILIGIIGALLNIIPYIGGIIAIALPMFMAVATKSPVAALWVFVVYLLIQFIDNNFIVPKIVASKVKINALISIIVVLIGGSLWGTAGMFLAIPLTAIVKVVFDRIEPLKPFGFLLGDNQPVIGKIVFEFKNPRKKNKSKI